MEEQHVTALLQVAANMQASLPSRISALDELAVMQDRKLVPGLRKVWDRSRPAASIKAINWDPEAAERVVDLHIILALGRSGDFSLLDQIARLVSQANTVLQGPENEFLNAAKVIRALGQLEPVNQIVHLAGSSQEPAQSNAVRTLQLLDLPHPLSGGAVPPWLELTKPLSFTIHRLAEELETVARLSGGRIELSSDARRWATSHDYDRGELKRQDIALATILERQIDLLDLSYTVDSAKVVILTFPEAGQKWLMHWPAYSANLTYDPAARKWVDRRPAG